MKRYLSAVILLVGLFGSVTAAQQDSTINGPRLVFNESTYDFGEILPDTVVNYTFGFSNAGNDTLRISTVYSS